MPDWMTTSFAPCRLGRAVAEAGLDDLRGADAPPPRPPLCLALTNLDFEYELAAPTGSRPTPLPAASQGRWRWILRLLPEAREALCPDPAELDRPAPPGGAERLVVWGVTPRVLRWAEQLGLGDRFPSPHRVREVNDKRFSHRLEKQLGIALPHSQVVESLEQLRAAVESCPYGWVLKHPLGFSGRERMVGSAGTLSDSAWGWARRKLSQDWSLLFEPWVEQRQDFSLHFDLGPEGQVSFVGETQLLSDPGGVYRGSRIVPSGGVEPEVHEMALRVAQEVARCGYWGPLGIDGLRGQLGDQAVLRPLVEINARYSFGRLTLALTEWVGQDGWLLWWHPSQAELTRLPADLPPLPVRPQAGFYALPLLADPSQNSGTVVVVAPSQAQWDPLTHQLLGDGATS